MFVGANGGFVQKTAPPPAEKQPFETERRALEAKLAALNSELQALEKKKFEVMAASVRVKLVELIDRAKESRCKLPLVVSFHQTGMWNPSPASTHPDHSSVPFDSVTAGLHAERNFCIENVTAQKDYPLTRQILRFGGSRFDSDEPQKVHEMYDLSQFAPEPLARNALDGLCWERNWDDGQDITYLAIATNVWIVERS